MFLRPQPVLVTGCVVGVLCVREKEIAVKSLVKLLLLIAILVLGGLALAGTLLHHPLHSSASCPGLLWVAGGLVGSLSMAVSIKKPTLLIVDDELLLAELLAAALTRDAGLRVTGLAHDATTALLQAAQARPDLVLLDSAMPGGSGLDLIAPLRQKLPAVKIIILSAHFDPCTVYRVLQSKVQGYVEKPSALQVLLEAVRLVLKGRTYFSDRFIAVQLQYLEAAEAFHKILSNRQQEILYFMSAGMCDADIAQHFEISELTVSTHRKHIRGKLTLHSDRELLAYARRWGLGPRGPANPPLLGRAAAA